MSCRFYQQTPCHNKPDEVYLVDTRQCNKTETRNLYLFVTIRNSSECDCQSFSFIVRVQSTNDVLIRPHVPRSFNAMDEFYELNPGKRMHVKIRGLIVPRRRRRQRVKFPVRLSSKLNRILSSSPCVSHAFIYSQTYFHTGEIGLLPLSYALALSSCPQPPGDLLHSSKQHSIDTVTAYFLDRKSVV